MPAAEEVYEHTIYHGRGDFNHLKLIRDGSCRFDDCVYTHVVCVGSWHPDSLVVDQVLDCELSVSVTGIPEDVRSGVGGGGCCGAAQESSVDSDIATRGRAGWEDGVIWPDPASQL